MKLQGHLQDYPFSLLLAALEYRRETGRLQIDFESGPGMFLFKDGKLIGADVGPVKGVQAVRVSLLLAAAPYQFVATGNVDINHGTSINEAERRQIANKLLGVPTFDANATDLYSKRPNGTRRILVRIEDALACLRDHARLVTAAVILLLTVPGVIAITLNLDHPDGARTSDVVAPATNDKPEDQAKSAPNQTPFETVPTPSIDVGPTVQDSRTTPRLSALTLKAPTSSQAESKSPEDRANPKVLPKSDSSKSITVIMQIEEGRIVEAYVKDHHPGWDDFETTAIRLARNRRYTKDKSGPDTIQVKVSQSR